MPIQRRIDSKGPYYQWGNSGKKYYYTLGDSVSRRKAYEKARRQAIAIYASGWRE
jgi:hypothetical protein